MKIIDKVTGMISANVFPLPVFAAPTTSLPTIECQRERRWISVGSVKSASLSPFRVAFESGSTSKELIADVFALIIQNM
jgi:hypothetical protein